MGMTNHSPYRNADALGTIVSEHRVTGTQQVVRIVLGLFCLLVAVDCVWLGMWARFGEIHWGAFIVTGIIGAIFFWLSWDSFAQYIKARGQRIVQHEFGLRIHDTKQYKEIRFDDIASVGGQLWQAPKGMPPLGAVMWLDDVQGQRFELPSPHAQAEELGQTIRSRTFDKRLADTERRIFGNEEVHFGKLALGDLVLVIEGEVVPRSVIESVRLSSRWLEIEVHGQRDRLVATEDIPNLDVLLALLRA